MEYTESFFSAAEQLVAKAYAAIESGNDAVASDLYLRAACLYRIARFPYITSSPQVNCPVKWRAWTAQKEAYMKAGRTWASPVEDVVILHTHRKHADRSGIPVYLRLPQSSSRENPCPAMVLLTGLDGYRPDNTTRSNEMLERGCAFIAVEIPGTADCPADPSDPGSADRLWISVLDWMEADGRFDMTRILVWGLSAGGYYVVRMAHTHAERLLGCVAQGAGVHHFFDAEWLSRVDGHEYPFQYSFKHSLPLWTTNTFRLTPALAMKHGYRNVETYKAEAQQKFSLSKTGILEKPSTKLLLVNVCSSRPMERPS